MQENFSISNRVNALDSLLCKTECTDSKGTSIDLEDCINYTIKKLDEIRISRKKVYIIGNGGSAAVASHAITDFFKFCKLSAHVLHEPAIKTCLSNDYGYENAFEVAVETSVCEGDILIAISSSGQSKNIINAVTKAKSLGAFTYTLSGFESNNPLRTKGDVNFWLDSSDYGLVEIGHLFLLHNLSDRLGLSLK